MITIHHLLVSQSERVIWLMEELGLPYELRSYPREPSGMAAPIFLKLHPLGSAPVIEDGDVTLAESLAIFTYILDLYGDGRLRIAPGGAGYAEFVYWFHYANAGLMPMAVQHLYAAIAGGSDEGMATAMMRDRFGRHLGMIEARLGRADYLAGDRFTAADILLQFPFGTMSTFAPIDLAPYPNIRAWLTRLSDRPAYQKAMRLAGHETDPARR